MTAADVDVLVVGGGPVGLVAAAHAARAGLDVAVVEPRSTPIDKACGEGLMPAALAALERLDVRPRGFDVAGIAYCQGALRAEHRFSAGIGRGVRRTTLHAALAERVADADVPVLPGRVERIEQDANRVLVEGPGVDGIQARWLIGCDGLHSTVRELVGLDGRPIDARRRRFGLRRHMRLAPWSDLIEVYWAPKAEVYVTPTAGDLVGIAVLGPAGMRFEDALDSAPELAERIAGAEFDGPVRGAGPLRQRTRARTSGHVLLAGDSSGYVDALTGEGLRVGFAQAEAAVNAVLAGDPVEYERTWRRVTRETRVLTSGLLAAARSGWRDRIVPTATRAPGVYGAIVERLAR
jgi:Dehydrogenases (flavoproteins)